MSKLISSVWVLEVGIVKTSSEKEIISILVSDTGAHIVRAPGKMKTTFHLRNRIEVSRN